MAEAYTVLGLLSSCAIEDVKKAYRKLALRWHPDKAGESGNEKMKEINAAQECIVTGFERREGQPNAITVYNPQESPKPGSAPARKQSTEAKPNGEYSWTGSNPFGAGPQSSDRTSGPESSSSGSGASRSGDGSTDHGKEKQKPSGSGKAAIKIACTNCGSFRCPFSAHRVVPSKSSSEPRHNQANSFFASRQASTEETARRRAQDYAWQQAQKAEAERQAQWGRPPPDQMPVFGDPWTYCEKPGFGVKFRTTWTYSRPAIVPMWHEATYVKFGKIMQVFETHCFAKEPNRRGIIGPDVDGYSSMRVRVFDEEGEDMLKEFHSRWQNWDYRTGQESLWQGIGRVHAYLRSFKLAHAQGVEYEEIERIKKWTVEDALSHTGVLRCVLLDQLPSMAIGFAGIPGQAYCEDEDEIT